MQTTATPPRRLAFALLSASSVVLVLLAAAAGWLSYRAQVGYVLSHNGGSALDARIWALLLDAGTAGVSTMRLYEALIRRPTASTRLTLFACIAASISMNLLHTPSRTAGGLLIAVVPPLMYAVFLEHLRSKLEALFTAGGADGVHDPAINETIDTLPTEPPRRRARNHGAKRKAFEAGLTELIRSGDLSPLSPNERERNAAAYQVAAALPSPLNPGTARRYSVQALPRLRRVHAAQFEST